MQLNSDQQIFEQINKAGKILIVLPKTQTPDAAAGALALQLFLSKMGKEAVVAGSGQVPPQLQFLPAAAGIRPALDSRGLIITVDTSVKKLEEISYETTDAQARIFLRGQSLPLEASDIKIIPEIFSADLVIILGAASLEALGELFEKNTEIFYQKPKINIDNSPANEYFGNVNLVDVTAASLAEILTGLLEKFNSSLIDEEIATALLTGIITSTDSFQSVHTTPQTFLYASKLVALGARQQEIVQYVYKTKSLPLLKLWGRALARTQSDSARFLAYSLLNESDLEKSGAATTDIAAVIGEMLETLAGYKIVALACLLQSGLELFLAVHSQIGEAKLLQSLVLAGQPDARESLGQYQILKFSGLPWSLAEAEKKLTEAAESLAANI